MNPILITTTICWFLTSMIDLITFWYDFDDNTQINDRTITQIFLCIPNIIYNHVLSHIVPIIHTYESYFDHNYNILFLTVMIDLMLYMIWNYHIFLWILLIDVSQCWRMNIRSSSMTPEQGSLPIHLEFELE